MGTVANAILYTSDAGATPWNYLNTNSSAALLDIHFTDSGHGWAVGDDGTVLSGFYSDTTTPLLTDDTPDLDVHARTLSITFNETINIPTTNLGEISITNAADTNPFTLTGATVPTTDSDTLVITLTEEQIQLFYNLTFNDDNPLQVTITANAVTDLAENPFAGITNAQLNVIGDTTAPVLTDVLPNLDFNTRILTFSFNETIDVSETNQTGIMIIGAADSGTVELVGATISNTDSNVPTLIPDSSSD